MTITPTASRVRSGHATAAVQIVSPPRVTRQLAHPAVIAAISIALAASVCMWSWTLPRVEGVDAPATSYSAERAARHLTVIASEPRPIGSIQWARTRDYIVDELARLNLSPRVERATVFSASRVVHVQNVFATMAGEQPGPGVMLSAHYDSVPNSPGAADDGAGVVTLLEVARALRAGGRVPRAVTFLYTDGEEAGLAGAEAFSASHPVPQLASFAVNIDARGSRGPALMFETGPVTPPFLRDFGETVVKPVATSTMPELYKLVDNNTDFTVFKAGGIPGFNFALVDGVLSYHTAVDTPANLDPRSLQHLGASVLALARQRFDAQMMRRTADEPTYFNLGPSVVSYSRRWAIAIAAIALATSLLALSLGLLRRRMTWRGLLLGVVGLAAVAVSALVVTRLVWTGLLLTHSDYRALPYGETYNSGFYRVALPALALGIAAAIHTWLARRTSVENLWGGALVIAALLAVAAAARAAGISYLFGLPALAGSVGLLVVMYSGSSLVSQTGALATAPCGLTASLMLLPLIWLLFAMLSIGSAGPAVLATVVLFELLIPQLEALRRIHPTAPAAGVFVISVISLIGGALTSRPSGSRPLPSFLMYVTEPGARTAAWMTTSTNLDEWQHRLMGSSSVRQPCDAVLLERPRPCLASSAPYTAMQPPTIEVVEEQREAASRILRLRVRSWRQASAIRLGFDREAEILAETSRDGPAIRSRRRSTGSAVLAFIAPPADGSEITCRVKGTGPLNVRIADISYGLDAVPGYVPRPPARIPGGRESDTVVVLARLVL